MKSLVKNITFRIFISILLAGITGIGGIAVLNYEINRFSSNYQQIIAENYVNKEYMGHIGRLVYQHQALVANHIRTTDMEEMGEIEGKETQVRAELKTNLTEFGKRMAGDEREQLYHNVYSNIFSYLKNVDVVFELSKSGDKKTANYYVTSMMSEFIENVNESIIQMEALTDAELNSAKEEMNRDITISRISAFVCTVCIIVAVLLCMFFSVRITARLERYKLSLEQEVERKNHELLDHNEKIMKIQENTVIGMANLIENRDGETGGHIKRTSAYVELLARTAQSEGYCKDILTDRYIDLLVKAAPMHDVGKIVVPDSILKKPGKLTDEEFAAMKTHAAEGGRIVREVLAGVEETEYIEIASDVSSFHHEKWNGKGYPFNKQGEDIPLSARIMAVADVFDALVSERCYKKAMPLEKAFTIIEEEAGEQFDPILARLFIDSRKDVERIIMQS